MLRLINAIDMNIDYVKEYKNSFKDNEINCSAIDIVDQNVNQYIYELEQDNLYFLIDDLNPNYILGDVSIDSHESVNYHLSTQNDGHIGGEIRPSERKKGYGSILLSLSLQECMKYDMKEVCVSCLQSNTASKKIILSHGGIFDCEWIDKDTGEKANKYWINLEKLKNKVKRLV